MKRKQLQFCFAAILIVFFVRKIPLELLFQSGRLKPFAGPISKFILNGMVILGCFVYASKAGLLELGGFRKPVQKNYWMFLLPFIFPGFLFLAGSESGCYASFDMIVITVALTLSGGILEEVLFRGVIQGYLNKQNMGMSVYSVCLLSATFFAAAHFTNLQIDHPISVLPQVIYAFYMGLYFSALLFRTNNVWVLGTAHGLLNLLSQKCYQSNDRDFLTGHSDFTISEYWIQIGGFILLLSPVLLIFWILIKTRPRS